jgi:hypothetical protein
MKTCSYCGKQYPDDATACAIDGQPLQAVVPATIAPTPPPDLTRQQIIDGEHLKLLSIFHFVVAGLAFCGLGFLFLHYLVMSTVFANPEMWKTHNSAPPFPKDFFKIFIWFYIFFGGILAIAGALNLLSAIFLRQRRHRIFSLVIGGLNCLQIPFGTVLGIFTIMVLSRDSVRETYAES